MHIWVIVSLCSEDLNFASGSTPSQQILDESSQSRRSSSDAGETSVDILTNCRHWFSLSGRQEHLDKDRVHIKWHGDTFCEHQGREDGRKGWFPRSAGKTRKKPMRLLYQCLQIVLRDCLFHDEGDLKLFNYYTTSNCMLECAWKVGQKKWQLTF